MGMEGKSGTESATGNYLGQYVDFIIAAYKRGLEDAFEMVLVECNEKDKEQMKKCIADLLTLLKEQKINTINDIIKNARPSP